MMIWRNKIYSIKYFWERINFAIQTKTYIVVPVLVRFKVLATSLRLFLSGDLILIHKQYQKFFPKNLGYENSSRKSFHKTTWVVPRISHEFKKSCLKRVFEKLLRNRLSRALKCLHQEKRLCGKKPILGEIQWFLGFQGPPTPADQGLCGFDKGRSLVVK